VLVKLGLLKVKEKKKGKRHAYSRERDQININKRFESKMDCSW
jgi:hypothetical protein